MGDRDGGSAGGGGLFSRVPGGAVGVIVASILFVAGLQLFTGGVAETPAGFGEAEAGADLMAMSRAGKPVLAVVTADWCGPCQAYKRGALSDGEVAARLEGVVERVMVDADAEPELAARLGARGLPTTVLIVEGEVVGGFGGNASAAQLLEWLDGRGLAVASAVGGG